MATVHDQGLDDFGEGKIDVLTDEMRVYLVRATFTPSASGDSYLNDVGSSGADLVDYVVLTSKTMVGGVFDAADVTFSAVSGGDVDKVVIAKWNTTTSDSPIIWTLNLDQTYSPNGGDIDVTFNASGIGKI